MSGGSRNYAYCSLAMELNIPSGSYGIGRGRCNSYDDDVAEARNVNPMHDRELSELMYDVSCLLHSLEWFESGDIGEEQYLEDVRKFKEKWFCRTSNESVESYKADVLTFLENIRKTVEK